MSYTTTNISKKKFRDYWVIYKLHRRDLGRYLNTWFNSNIEPTKKGKKKQEKSGYFYESLITFKRVDEETASHLYGEEINPVEIRIRNPWEKGYNYEKLTIDLYIHSIDDSWFRIYWEIWPKEEYETIKKIFDQVVKYISYQKVLSFDKLLEECKKLGAIDGGELDLTY